MPSSALNIPNQFGNLTTANTGNLDANSTAIQTFANTLVNYSNFFVDSGGANALQVAVSGSLTVAYTAGLTLSVKIAATNTGPTTIQINALGTRNVTNSDGSALVANQLLVNQIATMQYDGTNFQLQSVTSGALATFKQLAIGPAASGSSLVVTGNMAASIANLIGGDIAHAYAAWYYAATILGYVGSADALVSGGTSGDFAVQAANGFEIAVNSGVKALAISPTKDITSRGIAVCKYKAADTSRSTTTLSADPDLTYTLPGAGTYAFQLFIRLAADATAASHGFACGPYSSSTFNTALSRMGAAGMINGTANTNQQAAVQTVSTASAITYGSLSNSSIVDWVVITGSIISTSGGVFAFNWAQNTVGTGNTTVQGGSYMTVTLLS